jgi:cysteine desulfurase
MNAVSRIYLDNNSTTPLLPAVWEVMQQYTQSTVGNPASAHRSGAVARRVLDECRATAAKCLGAFPDEVIFTSGATEANNLAIFGLSKGICDIAVSRIEHPSALEPCLRLEQQGIRLHSLEVDELGKVREASFSPLSPGGRGAGGEGAQSQQSLLVVQLANHETGTVQDIAKLRQQHTIARFHTDATQAVGKIPVHFHQLGVTTLACSAHKFFGPPGIGVLLVNRCARLEPRTFGGHQQASYRPGTEPVMLAVGLAKALQLACSEMDERHARCQKLRQLFLDTLGATTPFNINGDSANGLVHTLNLSFPGCPSDVLFIRLDLAGIDCSTGSACSSGSMLASPVLQAMRVDDASLKSAMRFSLSHLLSEEQVVEASKRVGQEVKRLVYSLKVV